MTSPREGFNYNVEYDFEPAVLEAREDKFATRVAAVVIVTWLLFTLALVAGTILGVIWLAQQVIA